MKRGTIKWWNSNPGKGFGFITPDDGTADVFVHYSSVDELKGPEFGLACGVLVEFVALNGPKGPQAAQVKVIGREFSGAEALNRIYGGSK